ncbi:MAG: FliG C-terminal domain-containing protein [Rhodospirillaceae bacterium]
MFEEIHRLPDKLGAVASKLAETANGLKERAVRRQNEKCSPAAETLDLVAAQVAELNEEQIAPLVDRLRSTCSPVVFPRVLGTLLRLLSPEALPRAVKAAGADLEDAVLATTVDFVSIEDLNILRDNILYLLDAHVDASPGKLVSKILALVPSTLHRQELMNGLAASGPNGEALAHPPQPEPLTFEDIATLSDYGIRELIRLSDRDSFSLALIGAPETVLQRVFANMTDRAARLLKESIRTMSLGCSDDASVAKARLIVLDTIQAGWGFTDEPQAEPEKAWPDGEA